MAEGPRYGLVGLKNQGATCYLNSLLQVLYMTPDFRNGLYLLSDTDVGFLVEGAEMKNDGTKLKPRKILIELQKLFSSLQLKSSDSVSTQDLTGSFGWNNKEIYQQHDIQELNQLLLDAIEKSLVGTTNSALLSSLYRGELTHYTQCHICSTISNREESILDIILEVQDKNSLDESLAANFTEKTFLVGDDQYLCDNCGGKVDAERSSRISRAPPIMTFALRRFRYDYKKQQRAKVNQKFEFPEELDLGPYVDHMPLMYDLLGVVIHRGQAFGGHYHAYIRDLLNEGLWSEENCTKAAHERSQARAQKKAADAQKVDIAFGLTPEVPLEAFREILLSTPNRRMKLDQIGTEFVKMTGQAWRKHYRASYGSIKQFFYRMSHVFKLVDKDRCVELLSDEEIMEAESLVETQNTEVEVKQSEKETEENGQISEDKADDELVSDEEQDEPPHWFHFNDESVIPIQQCKLKDQFGGRKNAKESAYMLIYRRRNDEEHKLENVHSENVPAIPKHISEVLANQENEKENSQTNSDTFFVFLELLGEQYHQWGIEVIATHSMDDLKSLIQTYTNIDPEVQDIHIAHSNKLMRVSELSGTLAETGVRDQSSIFVEILGESDGKPLANREFDSRKKQLNIRVKDESNPDEKRIHRFHVHAGSTLAELKRRVLTRYDEADAKRIFKEQNSGRFKSELSGIIYINEKCTLRQNKIASGQMLRYEPLSAPTSKQVQIQYQIVPPNKLPLDDQPVLGLVVERSISVIHLKTLMASQASLDPENVRLRKVTRAGMAGGLIYNENSLISATHIQHGERLLLEKCKLPRKGFTTIDLYLRTPKTESNSNHYSQSPDDLHHEEKHLKIIESETKEDTTLQDPQTPPFQQTDETSQPSEPSNEAPNGTPEDIVHISEAPKKDSESKASHKDEPESKTDKKPKNPFKIPKSEILQIQSVEISESSSVGELKQQILSLPMLEHIPSIYHLRLSDLTDINSPSRIFKSDSQTIKKLFTKRLLIETLPEEEQLQENSILLYFSKLNCETRKYGPFQQVEFQKNADLNRLKEIASTATQIPTDKLLLAVRKETQWKVLKPNPRSGSARKKKNRNKKKKNSILKELKDRDIIGCKDKSEEASDSGFFTKYDEYMKSKLQKKRDKKKRRVEPVLAIHVEDFSSAADVDATQIS